MIHLKVQLQNLALFSVITCGYLWISVSMFTTQKGPRVIRTQYGDMRGLLVKIPNRHLDPIEAYLGLQYASVLGGELRFMPPTSPVEKWDGIRVAYKFRAVCPQKIPDLEKLKDKLPRGRIEQLRRLIPFLEHQAEECLNLNIYVPTRDGNVSDPFPVIMFIHGESYEMGTGNAYDGSVLASYGKVIVITINYRLGALGFMSTGDSNAPGNYGLLDQIAALHWVNSNIHAFGGDPKKVTLLGHGYGAAMANILLLSPVSRGKTLFQRVILQSGSALSSWAVTENPRTYTKMLSDQVNCSDHWGHNRGVIDCLKTKHFKDLVNVDIEAPRYFSAFGPVVDKRSTVPTPIKHLLNNPKSVFGDVEILLGVMKNEGFNYFSQNEVEHGISEVRRTRILRTYVRNIYKYHRQKVYEILHHHYSNWDRPSSPTLRRDSAMELLGDGQITAPMLELTKYYRDKNAHMYLYNFNYQVHADHFPRWAGGVHSEDLIYVFGAPLTEGLDPFPSTYTRAERMLSKAVMCYWTNFVKTGDPNRPVVQTSIPGRVKNRFVDIKWTPYDKTQEQYLHIDYSPAEGMRPSMRHHFRSSTMALWLDLIPKIHKSDDLGAKYHLLDNYANASTFDKGTRKLDLVDVFPTPPIPPIIPPFVTETRTSSPLDGAGGSKLSQQTTPSSGYDSGGNQIHGRFPSQTRVNTPNDSSVVSGSKGDNNNNKVNTLSLSVTVAVGCSLLFLNILIFAGMYYHKDRMRMGYFVRQRELENKASESQRLNEDTCKSSSYQESDTNCSSSAVTPTYASPWTRHHSSPHKITTLPKTTVPILAPTPMNAQATPVEHYNKEDSYRKTTSQVTAHTLSRSGTSDSSHHNIHNREDLKLKDTIPRNISKRENHVNQSNPVTMV